MSVELVGTATDPWGLHASRAVTIEVVSAPLVTNFIDWWTGQFVRLRRWTTAYYWIANSQWNEQDIRNHPSGIWTPDTKMVAEVWGDSIPTPPPDDAVKGNYMKTNGKARYLQGLPPAFIKDMRETDGVWVVDYNLLLAVGYFHQPPPPWMLQSDPEPE